MDSFYSNDELLHFGFAYIGKDVKISKKASIYGAKNISIGNHVRIDDFCILSGKIQIGSYVHIAAYVGVFAGDEGVYLGDFVGVSSRTVIYAASDDYTGEALTNPTIPDGFRKVTSSKVVLEKHVLVGTGSTILPGVILQEGGSFGAMSLINKSTLPWKMYVGVPVKCIGERKKDLLDLEKKFLEMTRDGE